MNTETNPTTLQIVSSNEVPGRRLTLARRHIETAISHLNDVAQSRIPLTPADIAPGVDELRLIVRALADIREALRASDSGHTAIDSTA